MPYNFAADIFSHKETLYQTSFERSRLLYKNRSFCVLSPFDHLRLIGKRVIDFLLVVIEHFLLGFTAKGLKSEYRLKIAVFEGGESRCILPVSE